MSSTGALSSSRDPVQFHFQNGYQICPVETDVKFTPNHQPSTLFCSHIGSDSPTSFHQTHADQTPPTSEVVTGRRQNKIKYSNSRHLYSLLLYTRRPCCCSTTRTHRTNPDGKNCLCLYCWRSVVPKKLLTHPTKSEGDGRRSDTSINSKQQKLPDSSAKLTAAPKKRCCPRDHTVLLSC